MILSKFWTTLIVPACICILFPGCAEKTATPPAKSPAEQSRSATPPDDQTAANKPHAVGIEGVQDCLVGIWLGQAILDADKVQQKIATLDGDARAEFESIVQDFMTTIMAIEFRADGTMDTEIELTFGGQNRQLEASHGTWQVIDTRQNLVTVATVEQLPDGTVSKSQQSFELYEGGNILVTAVPVQNALADLNPRLVFERETLPPEDDIAAIDEQSDPAGNSGRLR